MEFFVTIMGDKLVVERFDRLARAAALATPAMAMVAEYVMDAMKLNFQAQGRRGGGAWKQITSEWRARKVRMGMDPRILMATYKLLESVSMVGAEGAILRVTNRSATVGSKLPYAGLQNKLRPFNRLTKGDRIVIREIIASHLTAAWGVPIT
jgi:phage gpG-like protein